jgi:hypothetical protein
LGGARFAVCGSLAAIAILGLAVVGGCSDDVVDPERSDASTAGRAQDDDGSAGTSAGAGANAGANGAAGRGGGGRSGRGGVGGSAAGDGGGGKAGASAGTGTGSGAGDGGKGGAGEAGSGADNRCASDGDCVLCTTPLSTELPCCDGCPSVMSRAQCDAERAAAGECKPGMLPICPAISCVAPGSPKCEGGMCISVDGFEL